MVKKIDRFSLDSRGLKYKLRIAFYLMSVLPLLVCIYLVSNYVLPRVGLKVDITISIAISIIIAAAGFFVLKEVFDRIVSVSTAAKLIAAGDINRKLEVVQKDEVGDLGESLNQLTSRIRSNMDELKSYSERTTEINLEIQKRVIVLSSLLQISSLISQGAALDDILKLTTEKARLLANSDVAFLLYRQENQEIFTMKSADGVNANYLLKIKVSPKDNLFSRAITTSKPLLLDKQSELDKNLVVDFYELFRLKNTLAIPVFIRGRVTAILGIGNARDNFMYKKEDVELVDIFAKQIAIAIENDILMNRVEKLEIKDALTGLYNGHFIKGRLQEEIRRSITYRRPCAYIVMDIDNFNKYVQSFGSLQAESTLKKIAAIIRDSVTEIDRVARTADDEFAILLPEKNKRQAYEIAEDIRKKIEYSYSEEQDTSKKITVSAGVSENPLDGVEAEELIHVAGDLLNIAKKQGRNRVAAFKEQAV